MTLPGAAAGAVVVVASGRSSGSSARPRGCDVRGDCADRSTNRHRGDRSGLRADGFGVGRAGRMTESVVGRRWSIVVVCD